MAFTNKKNYELNINFYANQNLKLKCKFTVDIYVCKRIFPINKSIL